MDALVSAPRSPESQLRRYSEHACRFIFKLKHLDMASLAHSFGLVKMPKIDEMRGQKVRARAGVSPFSVAYL